ncbi:hypothetical protein [Inhella gelatinilytica]|uniref:hypothetical protein n=1 Tax=Inhella gelatinilytica TaxID=2795030 RepID=UPI0028739941|nr:hypothetical protein [Inhella gelatinilytica]
MSEASRGLGLVIREQHKALTWLHMDAGRIRALATVRTSNRALGHWSTKAHALGLSLFDLLTDPRLVAEHLGDLNQVYARTTSPLIQTLWRNKAVLGIEAHLRLAELKATIARDRVGRGGNELQTPVIPSRIYCAMLGKWIAGLDIIEAELGILLDAYRQSMTASRDAPADGSRGQRSFYRAKALEVFVERMKDLGHELAPHVSFDRFIAGRLNAHQSQLMHVVMAFTGMRMGEAKILPLRNAVDFINDGGRQVHLVNGYTHKLNKGVKKPTSWVTSPEGARAIRLAQQIAGSILQEVSGGDPATDTKALLFPSTKNPYKAKSPRTLYNHQFRLVERDQILVTQEDIDELDRLELERAWDRAGIVVGKPWPLAFHQLRRSLSVYAHRSGMVSLPALKAQLQHITDEMRRYYSDGYSKAVNLVFDPEHFSHEWNAAKAESSYFGYVMGMLFSDESLLGRGAELMGQTVTSRTPQETLKLFSDGKLAYKETVLGGCVATGECKTAPLEPIPFDCLESNCINIVVHAKRLERIIGSQESVVASLQSTEEGSAEHRLEVNHLKVLLRARQKLKEKTA